MLAYRTLCRDADGIAIQPGPELWCFGTGYIITAEIVRDRTAHFHIGRRRIIQFFDPLCRGIVKLTAPAKGCSKTGIHPLQIGHALEDRQDIFSKGRTRRARHHTRGNGYIAHQIPHRTH
ncbi:hypothetical protein D9M68_872650 [compost metagenome]